MKPSQTIKIVTSLSPSRSFFDFFRHFSLLALTPVHEELRICFPSLWTGWHSPAFYKYSRTNGITQYGFFSCRALLTGQNYF